MIDLLNDGTGLGFGIIGGKSTGVVVKTILPGGVADKVVSVSVCMSYKRGLDLGIMGSLHACNVIHMIAMVGSIQSLTALF